MTVSTTKTFRLGEDQAVSLPPEVAYEDGLELTVERSGDVVTLYPTATARKRISREEMFRLLRELPGPSEVEVRDPDIFPDRPNL